MVFRGIDGCPYNDKWRLLSFKHRYDLYGWTMKIIGAIFLWFGGFFLGMSFHENLVEKESKNQVTIVVEKIDSNKQWAPQIWWRVPNTLQINQMFEAPLSEYRIRIDR